MNTLRGFLLAALGLLCGLQAFALLRAPEAWLPGQIAVRLQPGEAVTLGRRELGAPQAELAHVQLLRTDGGDWQLRNLSAARAPVLSRAGSEEPLATTPVTGLSGFRMGGSRFAVVRADTRQAEFLLDGQRWRYDGATVYRNGAAQPACPEARWPGRMAGLWNRLAPHALTIARPLQFGGNLHCGNRIGVPGLAPDSAAMSRADGQLRLTDTAHAARPLAGVQSFTLGQTRFTLNAGTLPASPLQSASARGQTLQAQTPQASAQPTAHAANVYAVTSATSSDTTAAFTSADTLLLTPARRIALFAAPDVKLPAQVTWAWQPRQLWTSAGDATFTRSATSAAAALAALALAVVAFIATAGRELRAPQPGALAGRATKAGAPVTAARPALAAGSGRTAAIPRAAQASNLTTRLRRLLPAPLRSAYVTGAGYGYGPRPGHGAGYGGGDSAGQGNAGHASSSGKRPQLTTASLLLAAVSLLIAGACALLAQRAGHPPAASISLLLAVLSLALWLAVPGKPTLATACALLLIATGLLTQLELGLGAPDTSWLRYYQKTTALLAIGSAAATLWRLAPRRETTQRSIEYALLAYAALALLALAAQVIWGDETGVFDLQPVELAKLALTALTAHCLALRLGWRSGEAHDHRALAKRWLRLIAPALLFLALLAFALVQVDDYSPLVLLLLWSGVTMLAYALAAGNWRLGAALACVALATIASVALLRDGGPQGLQRLPSAFYADRFQVWLDPARHPHTGQQLLQGASAVAEGGLAGADSMFGLRALGLPAGSSSAIPAVQDDFAPSFFLNRHGLLPALLLWCLQAGFLAGLLAIAAQAARAARAARNFRHAWLARFRCFALCGGAAFVFGHVLLSWGTNLAIFPVMGQPMSFLSAGGSHLLFFLLPLLAFSAVSAQSLEE